MKKTIAWFGVGILLLPLSAILTFLLMPFWNWFEARFEIESLGHSGPATWCFAAVYFGACIVSFASWFFFRRKS
jgi:hypothetical protein